MKPARPENNIIGPKWKFAAFFLTLWVATGHPASAAGKGSPAPAGEEQTGFSAGGYLKNFFTVVQSAAMEGLSEEQPAEGISSHNFRIRLNWRPDKTVALSTAYELIPQTEGSNLAGIFPLPQVNPFAYRAYDLDGRLYPQPGKTAASFQLAQNLDRLFVTYSPAFGDIMIGRQPVAFGSAHFINPTDVLAPFTFQALDKEERSGVDAVRFKVPTGSLGEFDTGYVLGREGQWDQSALFVKQKLNAWDTDITGLVMAFRTNLLLGMDFDRSLGGASAWLEAAWVQAGYFDERKLSENYARLSLGADYNLTENLYGQIEYHYNGAGKAEPGDYPELSRETAYTEGAVYLLGRHYMISGMTCQISPLLTFSGQILWNLTDLSVFIVPAWNYSFGDDTTIEAGGVIPAGGKSGIENTGLKVKSEFGLYPWIYYASLKIYF